MDRNLENNENFLTLDSVSTSGTHLTSPLSQIDSAVIVGRALLQIEERDDVGNSCLLTRPYLKSEGNPIHESQLRDPSQVILHLLRNYFWKK